MAQQDRSKELSQPASRRLSRRFFLDRGVKLGLVAVAAPALAAASRLFSGESGGVAHAAAEDAGRENEIIVPDRLRWAKVPPEHEAKRDEANEQLVRTLRNMATIPEFRDDVRSFLLLNQGPMRIGDFQFQAYLRIQTNSPEESLIETGFGNNTNYKGPLQGELYANITWRTESAKKTKHQPDSLNAMGQVRGAAETVRGYLQAAMDGDTVEAGLTLMRERHPGILALATQHTGEILLRAVKGGALKRGFTYTPKGEDSFVAPPSDAVVPDLTTVADVETSEQPTKAKDGLEDPDIKAEEPQEETP